MKAVYFLFVLLFFAGIVQAQVIHHKLYTTYFNPKTHEPDSVSWDLTPLMITCSQHLARLNKFTADPEIDSTALGKDYSRSGYDQGHQMPAQDNSCDSTGEKECFYFSNMVPQRPELNRVTWKNLEVWCRKEAGTRPLHIICGVIGSLGNIGPDHVNIPAYCYKAIYDHGEWLCYIMPNTPEVKLHPFTFYRVSSAQLNIKTGLNLN